MELDLIRVLIHRSRLEPHLVDDIEARAMAFIRGLPCYRHDHEPDTGALRVWVGSGEPIVCLPLTTSRDALKRCRPNNWWISEIAPNCFVGKRLSECGATEACIWSDFCPTSELAELHCLLLAWAVERNLTVGKDRSPADIYFACIIGFDQHEYTMLDSLSVKAGVSLPVMAQRLALEALQLKGTPGTGNPDHGD